MHKNFPLWFLVLEGGAYWLILADTPTAEACRQRLMKDTILGRKLVQKHPKFDLQRIGCFS